MKDTLIVDLQSQGYITLDNAQLPPAASHPDGGLDVSKNCLTSFIARNSPQLADVQRLIATHNKISVLDGLEQFTSLKVLDISFNSLRMIDERSASCIAPLRKLTTLRCADNGMCFVDFSVLRPNAFLALKQIDFARNQLQELPDVSCCQQLVHLNVSDNRIDSLEHIHERLPLALKELNLANNELCNGLGAALTPLTFLANSITDIVLEGNTNVIGPHLVGWRPLVFWLLPRVRTIDGAVVTTREMDVAASLFRHRVGGELREELLEMLNEGRESQLLQYLRDENHKGTVAPLLGRNIPRNHEPPPLSGGDNREREAALPSRRSPSSGGEHQAAAPAAASQFFAGKASGRNGSGAPHLAIRKGREAEFTVDRTAEGTVMVGSDEEADVEDVLHAIQEKLRRVDGVVKVLWRKDVAQRHRAAVVIQKAVRGFIARRRLPRHAAARLVSLRKHTAEVRRKPWTSEESTDMVRAAAGEAVSLLGSSLVPAPAPPQLPQTNSDLLDLSKHVKGMDRLMKQVWTDVSLLKRFVFLQHVKAAITIQKHYRSFVARRQWTRLKREYLTFQRQFLPAVTTLQNVGRRYLTRKKIVEPLAKARELSILKEDVKQLKETVKGLQYTVQLLLRDRRNAASVAAQQTVLGATQ